MNFSQICKNIVLFLHPVYTVERRVERRTIKMATHDYGFRDHTFQELVKITMRNGKPYHRFVLDRETVPPDVMITLGCFGDTGGWRSRFAADIDQQRRSL